MITVIVKNKPYTDYELDATECENYRVNAKYNSVNTATSTDVAKMFFKAMEIEGYMPQSIARSFKEIAEYIADYYNFELDEPLYNEEDY